MIETCPFPISKYPIITLAHGGGGKMTAELIDSIFRPAFSNNRSNSGLEAQHDGAVIKSPAGRLALTTDSYVVKPLFFPGGDIGGLAVTGTVNDLLMCGAVPKYLTCGFILEEGLPTEILIRVVASMQKTATWLGVELVTGDTKVVERGHGDGIFINTSGVGLIEHDLTIEPKSIKPGDMIILSGDIGRHGIAVLAKREGLEFESQIVSDCAGLNEPVLALLESGIEVHCLRDLTRGGLATALVELALTSNLSFHVGEAEIQVCDEVRGACEILGLDPLYVANEGRFIAVVPERHVESAISILRTCELSKTATVLGCVRELNASRGRVMIRSGFGSERLLDRMSGEQLPRIC